MCGERGTEEKGLTETAAREGGDITTKEEKEKQIMIAGP